MMKSKWLSKARKQERQRRRRERMGMTILRSKKIRKEMEKGIKDRRKESKR